MKNIFCFFVFVFFYIFITSYAFCEEMTFSSALTRLYGVNESIAASRENINRMQYAKKAAEGLYYPKLSLNAGYAHFDDGLSLNVDLSPMRSALLPLAAINPALARGFPSSMSQKLVNQDIYTFNAMAVWHIFTGGKIKSANKAAEVMAEKAAAEGEAVKMKLFSELASLYFGMRLAGDIASVRKDVYNAMKDHRDKAIKMEEAGVLARVERMHAEVALSEAERSYKEALREAGLSKAALKSAINYEGDITPATHLFIVPREFIEPLSYFQENALKRNSQIKQLDAGVRLSDISVSAKKASFMPNVFLFGNADLYTHKKPDLMPDWVVGVGLTYNIFEGFGSYNNYRSEKSYQSSLQLIKIRAEKDIRTLIEQQYIKIENARADYEALQSSLAFTEEYLRARTKAFARGLATSLDVVDAELALSRAKIAAIGAAYKFDTALAKLLEIAGLSDDFEDYRLKASEEL